MSRELETVTLWRDGGGGLWLGRSGPERPWNWLTGTDASPDDLLLGESRKAEGPFEKVSPDDVRPSADLPDRDPRNGLTDTWRVVPGDRLATFEPGGLPKSWRISAMRRNAADLSLVVNDPVTVEPVEPDLMALLRTAASTSTGAARRRNGRASGGRSAAWWPTATHRGSSADGRRA